MILWPNWWKRPHNRKLESVRKPRCLAQWRMSILSRKFPWSANSCEDSGSISELVEAGISEEAKVFGTVAHVHPGKHAGKNQKPVKAGSSSKPNATGCSGRSTCGKMHSGVCRAATGACHRCGSMDHKVHDCPEEDLRPKSQNKGAGERVCYNCGETGHYKNQCPKDAQSSGKRPSDGPQPAEKRQSIMPRVYTIGDESMDPRTSRPITGTLVMGGVVTYVLFVSGASHCFVQLEMIGIGEFQKEPEEEVRLVRAAGGQIMYTSEKIRNVSVMIGGVNMPADLVVCPVKSYDFEIGSGKLVYQGARPTNGCLIISALQAERMLENGCEAYLAAIKTVEVGPDAELEGILIVKEYDDVFESLTRLPPDRSDPFTIEL
ncbi:uncharacterized protein LOC125579986 [Brassica napus]|uniref:uncharacterized protein LOC125579986 n=1 Tax=Brassica napus TaxID=3708 RepID=UPI002078CE20|nr:uncharacterized protein LOC125579986 [Brassica napus]